MLAEKLLSVKERLSLMLTSFGVLTDAVVIPLLLKHKRTVVKPVRLHHLKKVCLEYKDAKGAFVECGVGKGGYLALMKYFSDENRHIWGFDSFEGMLPLTTTEVTAPPLSVPSRVSWSRSSPPEPPSSRRPRAAARSHGFRAG